MCFGFIWLKDTTSITVSERGVWQSYAPGVVLHIGRDKSPKADLGPLFHEGAQQVSAAAQQAGPWWAAHHPMGAASLVAQHPA